MPDVRILAVAAECEWNYDPAELLVAEVDLLELIRAGRPSWQRQAACRGRGSAAWFPDRGETADAARAICAGCPVTVECGAMAAEFACAGVWAGMTPAERRRPTAA